MSVRAFATVAHELRSPLAALDSALQLVQRSAGDPSALRQTYAMMQRQVRQMNRLVDDLMDLSRIAQNKLALRKERVDLTASVQGAVETTRAFIEACGHELHIVLPTHPIYLHADPSRLVQVFANLLNNAAKYTERGGHIWLLAFKEASAAVVTVRDNGRGIRADLLEEIFKPFTQTDRQSPWEAGGLGVGLSLVRGLVETHGGAVEAHSDGPGKGSEFIVRLPAAAK